MLLRGSLPESLCWLWPYSRGRPTAGQALARGFRRTHEGVVFTAIPTSPRSGGGRKRGQCRENAQRGVVVRRPCRRSGPGVCRGFLEHGQWLAGGGKTDRRSRSGTGQSARARTAADRGSGGRLFLGHARRVRARQGCVLGVGWFRWWLFFFGLFRFCLFWF